jgi:hypothetical protein
MAGDVSQFGFPIGIAIHRAALMPNRVEDLIMADTGDWTDALKGR